MKLANRWILGSLLLSSLLGCATNPRSVVPVPAALKETSTEMNVTRRRTPFVKNPLRFGEWQVTGYKQDRLPYSRSSEWGTRKVRYAASRGTAAYHFTMTANDQDTWQCKCGYMRSDRGIAVGRRGNTVAVDLEAEELLECDLRRIADGRRWTLRVDGSLYGDNDRYAGTLSDGSRTFDLRATHEIENLGNLPGPPMGYFFVRDGAEIASTELVTPGVVRIGNDAGDDRDLIATASAALLLQPYVQ